MERLERELVQIEQARAIAAVQQEAHRIAGTLDQTLALQERNAVAAASVADQERRFQALADSMRQEIRSESLSQLKDVASMFVQHFKANRIAHAEVQVHVPEPKPLRMETAVQASPERASVSVGARDRRESLTSSVGKPSKLSEVEQLKRLGRSVLSGTEEGSLGSESAGLYSEDFHSLGGQELQSSKQTSSSIATSTGPSQGRSKALGATSLSIEVGATQTC